MIPTIGSYGTFAITAPYNTLIPAAMPVTVVSARALSEFTASGEDPLNSIYLAAGDTEASYSADSVLDTVIITFKTEGDEYIYVPSTKVTSDAKLDGVPYIEKSLMINLGHLPTDTDLTLVTNTVHDAIYNILGTAPAITPVDTSSTVMVPKVQHDTLMTTRVNATTVTKSWQTRYEELLALYNRQQTLLNNVQKVYGVNGIGG